MTNVQPVQAPAAQQQAQPTPPSPKPQQPATHNATPQDKVTISQQAQELAGKPNPAANGNTNQGGGK